MQLLTEPPKAKHMHASLTKMLTKSQTQTNCKPQIVHSPRSPNQRTKFVEISNSAGKKSIMLIKSNQTIEKHRNPTDFPLRIHLNHFHSNKIDIERDLSHSRAEFEFLRINVSHPFLSFQLMLHLDVVINRITS